MVELFLEDPIDSKEQFDDSANLRVSLLKEIEIILWSLITSGGRSEARLWLCNAISGMSSITPHNQRDLFMNLLRSMPHKQELASQLLQMIFEKRPRRAGAVISKQSHVLANFFDGNPRRISQWFSNFATGGGSEHAKGAKALSQFAFIYRDICWEELEWRGNHGQSPAIIATKPHYFLDLDVQKTVENFVRNVPEFWSSTEFSDSLKDGEIFFVETKFFVKYFLELMFEEDSEDAWAVVDDYLIEESFSSLCQHLLITLEEADFLKFWGMLLKTLNPKVDPKKFGSSSYLFEVILSKFIDSGSSLENILLLNAVINQRRQLWRLLQSNDAEKEQDKIKDVIVKISSIPSSGDGLAPLFQQCYKKKNIEAMKWLGLQSWVIQYRMAEECQTPQSWESLFAKNGISFRKSNEYAFVDCDVFEEKGLELDLTTSSKSKYRKRGKSRKKRRRDFEEYNYNDELLELDKLGLQLNTGSWFLSIDGYAVSWNSVDLPDHLSKHCLCSWMKRVFAKWNEY